MASFTVNSACASVQHQKYQALSSKASVQHAGQHFVRATKASISTTFPRRGNACVPMCTVAGTDLPPGHQNSRWPTGVPPVMGGHVMPSGEIAPKSTSTGCGTGAAHMFQYYDSGADFEILVHKSEAEAATGLVGMLTAASAAAIKDHGAFAVALSGGSAVTALSALADSKDVEFDKWHVFFTDERCVPLDSSDSNCKAAKDAFLGKVPVPDSQIYAINPDLSPQQAAAVYESTVLSLGQSVVKRSSAGLPSMDFVVLGVGPEGHTASLFPNSVALAEDTSLVVAVTNSPKPPAERISFSLPLINAASQVAVMACGAGKAEVVERALEMQALPGAIPVQMVRPEGALTWLIDEASAAELSVDTWLDPKAWPRSEIPKPARKKPAKKSA